MEKLNLLHKFLMIAVLALFVVNQSVLSEIQRDLHEALPDLRIKNEVLRQGTGDLARVTVTLRDGRTIEGYIDRVSNDGFTLVDSLNGKDIELAYRIVKDVREIDSKQDTIASGLSTAFRVVESLAGVGR